MSKWRWHTLYNVWHGMIRRCYDSSFHGYKRYGEKGITVCDEWKNSFRAFRSWAIQNGFVDGLTIDRINNSLGYSPENCRWATHRDQNRNYSRNHIVTYRGKSQCIADWADETGIRPGTILARINRGWTIEDLFLPVQIKHHPHTWSDAE